MPAMGLRLEAGTVIGGRYRLERLIGQGGMGAVWAAIHTITRRRVALKFLRGPAHARPELRRRFLREARAACLVEHPNVVAVHDVFEIDDDTPVMVMDLLEGETLGARLARDGALPMSETAALLAPVVSAVGTAHARGIVHRDLKPDNIFLVAGAARESRVKVLDFGIAKLLDSAVDAHTNDIATGTGAVLGTPCYMAPEQCFGERDIDHRADIWALGVILYEVLAGRRPIDGDNLGQVLKHMMDEDVVPLVRLMPDTPPDVVDLVRRMLARDRKERPADLHEVADTLARYTDVATPAFGAPSQQTPVADDEDTSGRVVVHLETTDPEGATHQAATPPLLDTAAPQAIPVPATGGRRLAVLGVGAVAVAGAVAIGIGLHRPAPAESATAASTSASAAATGPTASAPVPAAVPAEPVVVAVPVEAGSPTPAASMAVVHETRSHHSAVRHAALPSAPLAASAPAPAPAHSTAPALPPKPKGGLVDTAPF